LRKFNLKKEENVTVFIKKNSWTKKNQKLEIMSKIARNKKNPFFIIHCKLSRNGIFFSNKL